MTCNSELTDKSIQSVYKAFTSVLYLDWRTAHAYICMLTLKYNIFMPCKVMSTQKLHLTVLSQLECFLKLCILIDILYLKTGVAIAFGSQK